MLYGTAICSSLFKCVEKMRAASAAAAVQDEIFKLLIDDDCCLLLCCCCELQLRTKNVTIHHTTDAYIGYIKKDRSHQFYITHQVPVVRTKDFALVMISILSYYFPFSAVLIIITYTDHKKIPVPSSRAVY